MAMRSQNGYGANDSSQIATYWVPGTSTRLALRRGDVATVLLYVASEFDKRVEDIDTPSTSGYKADSLKIGGSAPSHVRDDWSFAKRLIRGSSSTLSNHASGTAIDLNATQHPLGTSGTFTAAQLREIRKILDYCDGVVRWGGSYSGRKDYMHWEVNASPRRVSALAKKIKAKQAGVEAKATAARLAKAKAAVVVAKRKAAAALAAKKKAAAAAAAALALTAGGATIVSHQSGDEATPKPRVTANASPSPTRTPYAPPTTHLAAPPAPVLSRTLRVKRPAMRGADVAAVRRLLHVRPGTLYTAKVAAVVKVWQRQHGMRADGVFGPACARKAGWVVRP